MQFKGSPLLHANEHVKEKLYGPSENQLCMVPVGLEPTTLGLLDPRSNQLSYETVLCSRVSDTAWDCKMGISSRSPNAPNCVSEGKTPQVSWHV